MTMIDATRTNPSEKVEVLPADRPAPGGVVVLVDEQDREVGVMPKLAAHENGGVLHRAFSVFVMDDSGRVLLQKRAESKYHFPGLWSNACCSHPYPGETPVQAGVRRLVEEVNIRADVTAAGAFVYEANCRASGLTEREYDHVLLARYTGPVEPNPAEASEVRWIETDDLFLELAANPGRFTPWFRPALGTLIATRFA